MNPERLLVRLRQIFLLLGSGLSLTGALLLGLSAVAGQSPSPPVWISEAATTASGPVTYAIDTPARPTPARLIAATASPVGPPPPTPGQTATPLVEESRATGPATGATSDTLTVTPTRPPITATAPATLSMALSSELVSEESYTSTEQVHPRVEVPASAAAGQCPASSTASFELVPIEGPPADHPDSSHPDFNLTLRGYEVVSERPELVSFDGDTAPDPPQLAGLFRFQRLPAIKTTYRVNDWLWDAAQCGGQMRGCAGSLIPGWQVTLVGLAANPGEAISIPGRNAQIYSGGFKALVLYADERQITLGYTRRDTVAAGYTIHLVGLCVDPNLLALYRAQNDANGWRSSGLLPALRSGQSLGTAAGEEIKVAVRDNGSFLDPRSLKDWWRGQ